MAARYGQENQALMSINEGDVRQALGRILGSRHFAHAPKKQKFLRLLSDFYLQGKAAELNEYLIGREVFDRDETYNPADDPIVRVGAHDVRKKLELYYQNEGAADEVRLEIPVGSYEPVFNRRTTSPIEPRQPISVATEQIPPQAEPQTGKLMTSVSPVSTDAAIGPAESEFLPQASASARPAKTALIVFGVATGLLLLAAGTLLWDNLRLRQQAREINMARQSAGGVWASFLKSAEPALLVLSNPAVYRLGNEGDSPVAVKRSVPLTRDQAAALTEALNENFAARNISAEPRLMLMIDTYTGVGEAIGAQRVTDLLRTAGKSVTLKRSRTVSAEDLKDHSAILFGSVWANEWSGKLPQTEDFIYTGQATIQNRNPHNGEEREYRSKFDERTGRLLEDYALITVKPSLSDENLLMVLSGLRSAGTEAAAEFVTNRNFLNELNQGLNQIGSPRYFQALLRAGVENGIPTTISLVTIHELRGK